jgi:hypothetical protein
MEATILGLGIVFAVAGIGGSVKVGLPGLVVGGALGGVLIVLGLLL